jgi:T4 RNase H, C terminal
MCDYFAENEYIGATALDDGHPQPVLIISGDKDFIQLHKYPNVKQYSPVLKKWLKPQKDARTSLRELIITGDKGDGIPNFRSADNAIVDGIRQKPIAEKKMKEYLEKTPEEFCETADELAWYRRNERLIDLTFIPEEVRQAILTKYSTNELNTRKGLLTFFMKHRMRNMIECVGDF